MSDIFDEGKEKGGSEGGGVWWREGGEVSDLCGCLLSPHSEWSHDSHHILVRPSSRQFGQLDGVKVRRIVFLKGGCSFGVVRAIHTHSFPPHKHTHTPPHLTNAPSHLTNTQTHTHTFPTHKYTNTHTPSHLTNTHTHTHTFPTHTYTHSRRRLS